MWERWDSKRERERGRQRQDGRGGPKIEGRIDEDSTGAPEGKEALFGPLRCCFLG